MHKFLLLLFACLLSSCGGGETTLQLECYGSVERLSPVNDGRESSIPHYRTTVRVYLRNKSNKSVLVASSDPAWRQMGDNAKFDLIITRPISVTGEQLSVSPASYCFVNLPPNGCAFLHTFISNTSDSEPALGSLSVSYSVAEDLGKEFGIWNGKLQCGEIRSSMDAAQQKAAREAERLFGKQQ